MFSLPILALKLLFTRPRLFVLGVFPGAFTFAASCALVYGLWEWLLQSQSLWVSLPAMMLALMLSWLVIGKFALIPVEDAIVDECQRALWDKVLLPSPAMSLAFFGHQARNALLLGCVAFLVLALIFLPVLAPLQFVLAAWLSAFSFLTPVYARIADSLSGRAKLFFKHPVSHFLLGAFLNFLLFVPVVNVFLLGFAQVLATLLYIRKESAESTPIPS